MQEEMDEIIRELNNGGDGAFLSSKRFSHLTEGRTSQAKKSIIPS